MEKVKIQFEAPFYTDRETLQQDIINEFSGLEYTFYAEKIQGSFTWKGETIDLSVSRIPK